MCGGGCGGCGGDGGCGGGGGGGGPYFIGWPLSSTTHHHNHHHHHHPPPPTTTISTSCYDKLRFSLRLYLIFDCGLEVIRA